MSLCECGCNAEVSEGKRFLRGHHRRRVSQGSGGVVQEPVSSSTEEPEEPFEPKLKVHIYPTFGVEDNGDGGVRRVVEGQRKHLPKFGIQIVETADEADLIACHITIPGPYLKLYPKKPLVAMCHGLYWKEYEWPNWALKANADVMNLVRIADAVTSPSEWVSNALKRHTARAVETIPHGIDSEDWQAFDTMPYVLWNKTRPDPVCDPEPVIQLAQMLPDIDFVSTFGVTGLPNLHLTGRLGFEDGKKLVQRASVYLCTSRETFGIGTLEAMACGIPVVGFRWGAQAEFIHHGVDGYLATPGDFDDLAKGIRWAFENRESAGNAAREKALAYTWDNAAEQYAELFKKVYNNKVSQLETVRTSIIVTNYNLHKYIGDCLDSVHSQTDKDWECIIVDDASPNPEGVNLARLYAKNDPRFKVIVNEKNSYLAESRNIGIRAASGRYILPLDADDMLTPDAVKMLADSLDSDRTIHVAYGNLFFVDEDGKSPLRFSTAHPPGHSGWPMQYDFETNIIQRNLCPYSSMYRKEAWKAVGGYRRRQRTAEDAELWARLASYGFRPSMVTAQDTLIYRVREGSMSSQQPETNWLQWMPWAIDPDLTPAGAPTPEQIVPTSFEPLLISVVIPVGPGHEKFVQDAVDSVEAQTFQQWECIVVNDTGGSIPELPSWVRVLETKGKTGTAHARNVGIEASRGKLFLPLDADDYLEPVALKVMYETWREEPNIIYSDFWDTGPDGKVTGIHECDDYDPNLVAGRKRTFNGQPREGMIHSVTALTPKAAWDAVGGYDESLPAWEDWDFALSALDKGFCSRRVALPLFTYRKNTGLRREENYNDFEASKEGILKKWGKIWEGGYELAGCRTCGARKATAYPLNSPSAQMAPRRINTEQEGVTLVRYIGSKSGTTPYRGSSGTVYWFGASEAVKYVLNQDMDKFMRQPDFQIEKPAPEGANLESPVLVAEGPPSK